MSFTYNPATALGKIRLRVGDTVVGAGPRPGTATNYADDEVAALQGGAGELGGAANVAATLAMEWARQVDTQAGPLRKSASQASARYAALAAELRAQAAAAGEAATGLPTLVAGSIQAGGWRDATDLGDTL